MQIYLGGSYLYGFDQQKALGARYMNGQKPLS